MPPKKNVVRFILPVMILLSTCTNAHESTPQEDQAYTKKIDDWHKGRIGRLRSGTGWLSLAGLFWLKEGENTFGSGKENDIVFPEKAADHLGSFFLQDGVVSIKVKEGATVLYKEDAVREMQLRDDQLKDRTELLSGSLLWYAVKRVDRFGIRLKDTEHQRIKAFKGIERFPVSGKWRIKSKFVPYEPVKSIPIPNVLGNINDERCPGYLEFEIAGQKYKLDVLGKEGGDDFFVIFGDLTNGAETYGAGRFVYTDLPDENGNVFLDFNKTYNPPCVFSEFATCSLPPNQNRLSLKVEAGEKKYREGH